MTELTEGHEVLSSEGGTLAVLNKSEIDQQIATAHKYPRSLKRFRDAVLEMVTLNEQIASECIYALPRENKVVEGPSARFGEIVASAWGNCRAGARVISDQGDYVTAQGVFHDLEHNVAITYEVQRRIVDKKGRRYSPDMIGVTANAACSIALRNAILKGIPKAYWGEMYAAARNVVAGDVKTLANRRADAIKAFQVFGVGEAQILEKLGRPGLQDIGVDDLVVLRGLLTAIRDGDTTPEEAFAREAPAEPAAKVPQPRRKSEAASTAAEAAPTAQSAQSKAVLSPGMVRTLATKLERVYGDEFPAEFCRHFNVEAPEHVGVDRISEALKWLDERIQ